MRRAAAVAVAFVAALAVAQVPMYSDYPWGLLNNGVDQGPVWNLNCKPPLVCSVPSYGNGQIVLGDGGTFGGLTLDDLPDGILYGRTRFGSLDAGYVTQVQRGGVAYDLGSFFAFPLDTLDKVPEGATFGRTARGDLDGGHVAILLRQGVSTPTEQLFQKATALTPDTLDGVPDGTLTGRVAKGNIDGGAVVLDLTLEGTYGRVARAKLDGGAVVLDLTLDGTFAKVLTSALDAGYVTTIKRAGNATAAELLFQKAATTDPDTLDGVPDGTNTARVAKGKLDGGSVVLDLTLDGTFAKVLTSALDAGYVTQVKRSGVATPAEQLFQKSATTSPDTLDGIPEGTVFGRPLRSGLDAGSVVLDLTLDGTFAKVLTASLDAGYVTQVKRSGAAVATESLFKKALTTDPDTVDGVPDGTSYARTAAGGLTSGYVSTLSRGGTTYATSTFFQKALDNLDNVTDGTNTARVAKANLDGGSVVLDLTLDGTYGRVKAANLTSGVVSAVDYGSGTTTSTANLFRKSTDTFASVAGTLADGQLGSNVVNTSNIKDANITTAKVADLGITAAKLDDGMSLVAYDEAPGLNLWTRATATNCTKVALDGTKGYITFNLPIGATNPQVSTTLTTGTSTTLTTTRAVMRYRIAGGANGKVSAITAINNAATAQTATASFLADGSWHTAVWDISGWTTAGTLRVDLTTTSLGTSGTWDIAYLGTGNPGSGTGALLSYQGAIGIGVPTPGTRLSLLQATATSPSPGTAGGAFSLLGPNSLAGLYMGVDSNAAAWLQPMRNDSTTTTYNLLLAPAGGNVGINTSTTAPSTPLHVRGSGNLVTYDTGAATGVQNAILLQDGTTTKWQYGKNSDNSFFVYDVAGAKDTIRAASNGSLGLQPTSGNVGIGTTGPGAKLDVQGYASNRGNSYAIASFAANNTLAPLNIVQHLDGTNPGISAGQNSTAVWQDLTFLTSNLERFRITSGGKVGIGQNNPSSLLDLSAGALGNTAGNTLNPFRIYGTSSNADYLQTFLYRTTTSGTSWTTADWYIERLVDTTQQGSIKFDGAGGIGFTIGRTSKLTVNSSGNTIVAPLAGSGNRAVYSDANGTLTNTSSDATLKTNVEDLRSPLAKALALRPVSFNWIDAVRFGAQREIGFLAQEVMQVVPEVVGRNADGTYTVDYPKLVAVLAGAVRELYDDRTALAERAQALEDRAQKAEERLAQFEARLASLEAWSGIAGCPPGCQPGVPSQTDGGTQ